MLIIFLKLLLAHILGDFVLQPGKWVVRRRDNAWYLLMHVLIHAFLLVLFFLNEIDLWWENIFIIVCAHLAIDSLKVYTERKWSFKPVYLFTIDQILHIAVLLSLLFYQGGIPKEWFEFLNSGEFLLYIVALLILVVVSPIFLRVFFSKWDQENDFLLKRKDSLLDAGALIGIMERLIIVLFIQVGFLPGIGFLMAAKSIFRFGDLTNAKNTKFTEYIMLGTLVSFTIAIVIGYLLKIGLRYLS